MGTPSQTTITVALYLVLILCSIVPTEIEAFNPSADNLCTLDAHCLHGGLCKNPDSNSTSRHCHCKEGFSGPRCSHYCPYSCQNGGYCSVTPLGESKGLTEQSNAYEFNPEDYICKCFGRFTGTLCETPYVNCGESGRCFNGGACKLQGDSPIRKCACPRGFAGESCELKIEDIESGLTPSSVLGSTKELFGFIAILAMIAFVLAAIVELWRRERRKFEQLKFTYYDEDGFTEDAGRTFQEGKKSQGILVNVI